MDTLFSSDGYDIHDTAGAFNIAGGVVVQPDDKIVVSSTVGTGNAMLLRYTTAGALDTTFDTDGVVETNIATGTTDTWVGINHTWDGKLIVSGYANVDFAAGRYFSGAGLDQRLYVQQDANWNVTSVSNSFGSTVERYRFTPYGQRTVLNDDFTVDGDNTSDYAFNVGHQGLTHDGETGLIYNRARYLHNTLGRFTAEDPLGTAYQDGMNLYEYVRGNPNLNVDPFGLESLNGPIDGLAHWYGGGGFPADLGEGMTTAFRRNIDYQQVIARIIEALRRTASCGEVGQTHSWSESGEETGISTGPLQMGFSGSAAGYLGEWSSNWELNTLVGTVESLKWNATLESTTARKYSEDGKCYCDIDARYNIRFEFSDRYAFDGGHNVGVKGVVDVIGNVFTNPAKYLQGTSNVTGMQNGRNGSPYQMTSSWNEQATVTINKKKV